MIQKMTFRALALRKSEAQRSNHQLLNLLRWSTYIIGSVDNNKISTQ